MCWVLSWRDGASSGTLPLSCLWAGDTGLISLLLRSAAHSPENCHLWKKKCISLLETIHGQAWVHLTHDGDPVPVNISERDSEEEPHLVQGWGETGASAELWLTPRAGTWLICPWLMTSCVCLSHAAPPCLDFSLVALRINTCPGAQPRNHHGLEKRLGDPQEEVTSQMWSVFTGNNKTFYRFLVLSLK